MQQQVTNLRRVTKLGHFAFLMFLLLGFASPDVLAKGPSAIKADKGEVQRYLHGKYKIKEILIEEREDTYHGRGHWRQLSLGGETRDNDITPPAARNVLSSKDPRKIAKAFLAEEADLLGLTPISEMREVEIKENVIQGPLIPPEEHGTHVGVGYDHYLNSLRLDGTRTGVSVGPSGKVLYVYAEVVDITPALLEAVKQPSLPQTEIRRAIKKDLIANGKDPDKVENLTDEKYAIPMSPYVIWEVELTLGGLDAWIYRVNAFTGQIIRKDSAIHCDPGPCTPTD